MRKATKRSLQMCLTIVAGFITCWLPYYALYVCLRFGLAPREVRRENSIYLLYSEAKMLCKASFNKNAIV
jgi:hypothetical protein